MSWCLRPFVLAVLLNPANADEHRDHIPAGVDAARTIGLQINVLNASTSQRDRRRAFARERPDALFVAGDPFFSSRRVQFATLASAHTDSCGLFEA